MSEDAPTARAADLSTICPACGAALRIAAEFDTSEPLNGWTFTVETAEAFHARTANGEAEWRHALAALTRIERALGDGPQTPQAQEFRAYMESVRAKAREEP